MSTRRYFKVGKNVFFDGRTRAALALLEAQDGSYTCVVANREWGPSSVRYAVSNDLPTIILSYCGSTIALASALASNAKTTLTEGCSAAFFDLLFASVAAIV